MLTSDRHTESSWRGFPNLNSNQYYHVVVGTSCNLFFFFYRFQDSCWMVSIAKLLWFCLALKSQIIKEMNVNQLLFQLAKLLELQLEKVEKQDIFLACSQLQDFLAVHHQFKWGDQHDCQEFLGLILNSITDKSCFEMEVRIFL